MKEISENKLSMLLEIEGLSSPAIVKIMNEAKESETWKIINNLKFIYSDKRWWLR